MLILILHAPEITFLLGGKVVAGMSWWSSSILCFVCLFFGLNFFSSINI